MKKIKRYRYRILFGVIVAFIVTMICVADYRTTHSVRNPKILTIDVTTSQVGLTWEKMTGNYSYIVTRQGKGSSEFLDIGTTDEDHYVDTTVEPGRKYQYQVVCYRGTVRIGSKIYTVKTKGLQAVDSVAKAVKGQVEIKWTAGVKRSYQILRKDSKDGEYNVIDTVKAETADASYTDQSVEKGKTYYYAVSRVSVRKKGIITRYGDYNAEGMKVKVE